MYEIFLLDYIRDQFIVVIIFFLLLLNILFISPSMNLWKIIWIPSLCSYDKVSLPPFTFFSFQLPTSPSVSQIIKELSSSSSYNLTSSIFNYFISFQML